MAVSPLESALIETWTLYGIGTVAFMLRIFSRARLGVSGYCIDDYTIIFAWACYTVMTVAAHMVDGTGDTSHLTMEERLAFTHEEAAARQSGTKWFMVGWFTYIGLIWTLKLNMLLLYKRVVSVVWVKKFLLPAMIIVGISGVSIWILFASACRPFHKLWQILPDPGKYCMPQSPAFLITVLVLNLFTDLIIILIPIPIIWPLKISLARKLGLLLMFCAGIFVMIAAILRVYFVLSLQKGQTAAIWSCREDVVAIVVGQATMIRPVLTRRFWTNGTASSTGYNSNKYVSHELSDRNASQSQSMAHRMGFRKVKDPYGMSVLKTKANESEEEIINKDLEQAAGRATLGPSSVHHMPFRPTQKDAIQVTQEVNVSSTYGDLAQQSNWRFE
ncbi:hypothetical protein PMIN04_007725 [Paraphaeosphaeria minitans]|uniref:Rhodopsin domain-containing protein n=1 Tax=Paraphaeosphaeria minitans TaxID=565426 RepID=A0A9P6KMT5_9PLEO|nr:hypothetical protein PMIN01_13666 [Paraphaeosphaeria minitans]KAF9732307.1 hypothetical protein PMIN01_09165 [Paraphaeosphaeria minitans]